MLELRPLTPTTRRRIVAGLILVFFVAAAANYYMILRWFRGYDGQVLTVISLIYLTWSRCFLAQTRKF